MGGCIFCTVINLVYFVICVVVEFATTASKMRKIFKGHPVGSKAKADRGITPTLSKEYWLLTRQLIPAGSGKSQIYKFLSVKINGIPFHALLMTQEFHHFQK
jgi:ATP adenylyltransferase/5',5'''-P-1,P-4-tetraphosphate phosphorylase II